MNGGSRGHTSLGPLPLFAHAARALLFDSPASDLGRYADNSSQNEAAVIQYSKLAVLLFRTSGILILLYATPMLLWGGLKAAAGATTASDGTTNLQSVILAWGTYAVAGVLVLLLARPLGHVAARGLEDSPRTPPAA
jgi:hypothetical protein